MNSFSQHLRRVAFWAPLGAVVLVTGCAGSAPMRTQGPAHPASPIVGSTNAQPAVPAPPNESTVVIVIARDIRNACNISDTDAFFGFDSSRLTWLDQQSLGRVADCFIQGPLAGRSMRLVGHADPRGPAEYNLALGQARADSVAGYLGAHGVNATQLVTTSRGDLDATGRDELGWAYDRHVDILLGN